MHHQSIQPTFESWRAAARILLDSCVHPDEIIWTDTQQEPSLFASSESSSVSLSHKPVKVSKAFMDIARTAAAHRDPRRWAALYRILWRITHGGESHLLLLSTDPELRLVQQWCKTIGRDIHKMHAFVRFRLIGQDPETQREQFVAWFEPEHRIVRLASPFFQKRFASMDWSILTPDECVHGHQDQLLFTPGVTQDAAPTEDSLEDLWRTYYRSIFNPARLKVKAMQSEMPKKYWKNLPESSLIDGLIAQSQQRVQSMLESEERPVKPAPKNAYLEKLHNMNQQNSGETL